jgi:hypothetical protein
MNMGIDKARTDQRRAMVDHLGYGVSGAQGGGGADIDDPCPVDQYSFIQPGGPDALNEGIAREMQNLTKKKLHLQTFRTVTRKCIGFAGRGKFRP